MKARALSLADILLATGTTGSGGTIILNTAYDSWEVSSAWVDASGADGGSITHIAGDTIVSSAQYLATGTSGIGGTIDLTAHKSTLVLFHT